MGPICQMCNEQLGFSDNPHACDPKKVIDRINKLQDEARSAEKKLDDIRNAVFMVLQSLPSLDPMIVEVETESLRKLWWAAECQWWEAKTADSFLSRWMVTHRVLCEAFDLFRSKKYGKIETTLEKLKILREACDSAKEVLGYQDSKLDMTPEDVVQQCQ